MSLFDLVKRSWNYGEYKPIYKGLSPTQQFWKDIRLKKSRKVFGCICCGKDKPKGTMCIGGSWEKVCFSCFKEWIKNSNKTLLEIQKEFGIIKKELNENEEKWERELIINSLSD